MKSKEREGSAAPAAAWADLGPLLGGSGADGKRAAWRRSASASSPESLAASLRALAAEGLPVLSLMDERLSAAWRLLRKSERPALMALVPNARGMIREATEHGMIGAGVRRVRRLGPLAIARLGIAHLADGPGVLRRDFPTMLRVLNGVESGEAIRLGAAALILSPQMTDLALAMDHAAILRDFVRRVERRGLAAGLATNNPAALAARLEEFPDAPAARGRRFVVPLNARKQVARPGPALPPGWSWAVAAPGAPTSIVLPDRDSEFAPAAAELEVAP
jgi:hypothetical protein